MYYNLTNGLVVISLVKQEVESRENKKEQKMLLEIHIYVLDDDLYDLPSSQLICCSFSYLDSISLLKITMA